LDSIAPDAVNQGHVGDCYFLGPLASLASSDAGKQTILNMIKDNGPDKSGRHTYTVTFPGAPNEPINVAAPTDSEVALYNGSNYRGVWASVVEKAYGKFVNARSWRRESLYKYSIDQDSLDGSFMMAGHKILSKSYSADEIELKNKSAEDLSR